MSEEISGIERFAPTLAFSRKERYFPCELFFAGRTILHNRRKYLELSAEDRLRSVCCYVHVVRGDLYDAYEYWYYYVFNEYVLIPRTPIADNHDHDFEYAMVFVNKESGRPEYLCLNQHFWHNYLKLNGKVPTVHVEEGGHGMFVEQKVRDRWSSSGLTVKPQPNRDLEGLRKEIVKTEPRDIIDSKERFIGENYDPLRIGKFWGPTTPWSRTSVYCLPIAEVLQKVWPYVMRPLLLKAPEREVTAMSLPYTEPTLAENASLAIDEGLGSEEDYELILRRPIYS